MGVVWEQGDKKHKYAMEQSHARQAIPFQRKWSPDDKGLSEAVGN